MRKFAITAAVIGLTALGLTVPATTAQAADTGVQATGCNNKWPGRNGNVYAWDGYDCQGALLGQTAGDDPDWNAAGGGFAGAWDRASSVMNAGYTGGRDVVQFWFWQNYEETYTCLSPNEYFADNLSDNSFNGGRPIVDNNIRSHRWVTASACATWLT
ncbi:hypothetical protein OG352_26770 [Streptomyces sp. NBC_01485]|uniref:hypothetical protein n=1 Tax=Streptomyces sp. NBC_01485 TaxID=2903884 RepID=UPI002E361C08|nr:hypothetical protein [Streptomyces sp. NBC_01485]